MLPTLENKSKEKNIFISSSSTINEEQLDLIEWTPEFLENREKLLSEFDPLIIEQHVDELRIYQFLKGGEGREFQEFTVNRLQNYLDFVENYSSLEYLNIKDQRMQRKLGLDSGNGREIVRDNLMQHIYGQCKEGRPVIWYSITQWNKNLLKATEYSKPLLFLTFQRTSVMLDDIKRKLSKKKNCLIQKHIVIIDVANLSPGIGNQLRKIIPIMNNVSDIFPEDTHSVYFINAGWAFRVIMAIIRPVLSSSFTDLVSILSEDELFEKIDRSEIPEVYGGENPEPFDNGCLYLKDLPEYSEKLCFDKLLFNPNRFSSSSA